MESKIIESVIESVNSSIHKFDDDKVMFNGNGYEGIQIKKDNFRQIPELLVSKKIGFIDGGNIEVISGANFALGFVRVYGCVFDGNKRVDSIKNEFYVLVKTNKELVYEAELFPVKGNLLINKDDLALDSYDKTISEGISRGNISKIVEVARKFAEIKLSCEIVERLGSSGILVMDGSLQSIYTNQEKYMEELYRRGKESGVLITGLSKTSRLFTDKGNSMIGLLNELGPSEAWYYYPSVRINNDKHKAELYFVKLNKSAEHVFRFEVYKEQKHDINEILSRMMQNANDIVFPGYPYGLLVADKFARVSNVEKEYIKTMLQAKAKEKWGRIKKYVSSINAHEVLDNIS